MTKKVLWSKKPKNRNPDEVLLCLTVSVLFPGNLLDFYLKGFFPATKRV